MAEDVDINEPERDEDGRRNPTVHVDHDGDVSPEGGDDSHGESHVNRGNVVGVGGLESDAGDTGGGPNTEDANGGEVDRRILGEESNLDEENGDVKERNRSADDIEDCDVDNLSWMPFVPREVWEKCFDYLSLGDLTAVARTCLQFSNIANDSRFWRNVDFGHEWRRFLSFHPEFLVTHLGGHSTSISLSRSPGFEFRNEDDFLSSLSSLPLSNRLVAHPIRFTRVDLSAVYRPNIRCDVISVQNASDRLAEILLPLNDCLESLEFPKGPQFSRFLTSTLSSLPASEALLPNLSSLTGSFSSDDVKLLPTLPRLKSLHLDGHVYKDSHAVTLHVFTKLEPTYLWPLLDCAELTDLGLPLIDAKFVSLFSPGSNEPSPLAFNLRSLTLNRVHVSESYLSRLLSSCSRLQSLNIRELRLFNPHHTNPFSTMSPHLRQFRLRFPRDGEVVPSDLESHLLASLSALPSLESVEFDDFSCRPDLVCLFPALYPKIRSISFRSQSNRDFVSLIAVVEKLNRLESLYLNFPETHVENDDGAAFPHVVKFHFAGKYLRIRGEASPRVFKFMIQPPYALNTLDVGVNTLGLALLKWPSTLTPWLSKLKELLLQVESPWHEDVMGEILAATTSLKRLHVIVASGGELAAQREAESLLRDDADGGGIASGFKTFHSVVEFLETSRSMEELNFTFATPLPYQMSGTKLTISGIKETLLRLKERAENSRLKCVNVNVAVINSLPWKMQLVRNCLGRLDQRF